MLLIVPGVGQAGGRVTTVRAAEREQHIQFAVGGRRRKGAKKSNTPPPARGSAATM